MIMKDYCINTHKRKVTVIISVISLDEIRSCSMACKSFLYLNINICFSSPLYAAHMQYTLYHFQCKKKKNNMKKRQRIITAQAVEKEEQK